MTQTPLELSDDDFAQEAPPGYRSQKHKDRYLPLVGILLFVCFIAPYVMMFAAMPLLALQTTQQGMPQYAKLAYWQGALWYPTWTGFAGQSGNSRLSAVNEAGQPLADRKPIELAMQPDWLLANGERMWAVSRSEVAEIFPDEVRPLVMRPSRLLQNPMRPFLHENQLCVLDHADEGVEWLSFQNGEWVPRGKLSLPMSMLGNVVLPDVMIHETGPDEPADALHYENWATPEELAQAQAEDLIRRMQTATSVERIISVIETSAGVTVFAVDELGTVYVRQGLPLAGADAAPANWSDWEQVATGISAMEAIVVGQQPAVLIHNSTEWTAYTRQKGVWTPLTGGKPLVGSSYLTDLGLAVRPGGDYTLAVDDDAVFYPAGKPILAIKPDGVTQTGSLGSPFNFEELLNNRFVMMQVLMQVLFMTPFVVQILALTWLMQTHRDPNFYRGRTPVAYASVLRRVIAAFFDTVLVYGVIGAIWYIWYLQHQADFEFSRLSEKIDADPQAFFLTLVVPPLLYTAAWLIFITVVLWIMLGFWGCTPGKFLCGVRVVQSNLKNPGLFRSLIRTIIWPFETSIMNGLCALILVAFTANRQRLADLVSGLVVVRAGSLRRARAESP